MSEIQCTFGSGNNIGTRDSIVAKLRKPDVFKGSPLFADDRSVDPDTDAACQIRPDIGDPSGLRYSLKITDFSRCGVLKRNVSISEFFSSTIAIGLIICLKMQNYLIICRSVS